MVDVTIRPARDDDDLDAPHAGSSAWIGQEFLRTVFNAEDDAPRGMWVAELEGTLIGYAHAYARGVADGHRGLGHVFVSPAFRGRGTGRLLWEQVLSVCTPDRVPGITASIDAADPVSRQVAVAHGWTLGQVHVQSSLDLETFDPPRELLDHRPDGIDIRPLSPGIDESVWLAFFTLFTRLSSDTPDAAQGVDDMPYEIMRATLAEPWQVTVAWEGEVMVGFTALSIGDSTTRRLETLMTGVDRAFRGRGLSTALKATHAAAARASGWRSIATLNLEGNAPILASNRTLGFQRVSALQDLMYDFG